MPRRPCGRAAVALARCEGAHTPLLATAVATAALTTREREITLLAAAGNASKDIAQALALSVRTVDNHLHHAYTKLGVTTRRELARSLAAAPPVRARTGGTVPRDAVAEPSWNPRGPAPVPGRRRCRSSPVGGLPGFHDGVRGAVEYRLLKPGRGGTGRVSPVNMPVTK